ncbi:hypothetical protein E4U03_10950 [Rothia nasimurium]|uniref:Prohead serine protease domain-containing protein n=1 Tax=Rothia nasimurium TaxID=85336 RepID=A0A4Y9F1N1_9MICC|nr:HK97 family phage prohead protease [Rothia nasimurium]MBF0809116.1 HK97 family phage prohead protease [Rothia nasimurium]TFU20638.1 hypothetical protein E4U03_10950 [Rothia nasimurium]
MEKTLETAPPLAELTAAATLNNRRISGRIAVFDTPGSPNMGRMSFAPGSITIPEPLSKVKLLINHDKNAPVGYMESYEQDAHGIKATFVVAETDAGDMALAEAKAKIRDGLSVGAMVHRLDPSPPEPGTRRIINAALYEVSLVSVPAFEDTLVESVTASLGAESDTMTENQNPAPETTEKEKEPVPTPATPPVPAEGEPSALTAAINAANLAPVPAATPPLTVTAAADRLLTAVKDGENIGAVMAALSDVVPANDKGEAFFKKFWIGELWKASVVERPFIEGFGSPGKLTGLKAYGWRWVKTPEVGKYNSDKTAIPSNTLSTEMVEGEAQDFAAGWDVARKYIDLGNADAIAQIFQLAADDYRRKTEEWFSGRIIEQATELDNITSALGAMKTIPRYMKKLGAHVSKIKMGEALYDQFLELSDEQVPWWLKAQGSVSLSDSTGVAAGVSVEYSDQLEAHQVMAWDSRAATYYEHGSSPIRLQALDIPRGGIDISVHGYAAEIVHDPRAIIKATVTPAAG